MSLYAKVSGSGSGTGGGGGSSTTPGGTTGQIQYNNAGTFGGDLSTTDGAGNISVVTASASTFFSAPDYYASRINFAGAGICTIQAADGGMTTYNFNMPDTAGTIGQLLTSGGGAGAIPNTWTTPSTIVPAQISVTSVSTNTSFYPTFVNANTTGTYALDSSTAFFFNPSSGLLSATAFIAGTQIQTPTLVMTGSIEFLGSGSGDISIKAQAAAGTYNFNLPTTAGTSGQVLTSAGGVAAPMTWSTPSTASATSTIVDDTTTNATMYPTWVTASSGSLPLKVSSTKIFFNPSTGLLTTVAHTNTGQLGVIAAPSSSDQVAVNGTSTLAGTTQRAFNAVFTATSSATAGITGYRSQLSAASATAVTTITNFASISFGLPGGATATNFVGFLDLGAASHLATNNATLSDTNTPIGSNFLYQSGSDPSVLTGALTSVTSTTSPLVIGGTGAASTLVLESTSGAGTTDAIIFKTASQIEAMRVDTTQGLRIGTTASSVLSGVTEKLSLTQATTPSATSNTAMGLTSILTGDSANAGTQCGLRMHIDRTVTVSQTDTQQSDAFLISAPTLTVPTGQIITNTNSTNGYCGAQITMNPTITGGGTIAYTSWLGINILAGTTNTGARKTALFIGAQSGATNNASISDNKAYTGTYFINSTDTNPSLLSGSLTIPSIKNTATQTVVSSSTSGSVTYSQPEQGSSYKKVIAYCSVALGTASYTFPTAFTNTPAIVTTNGPASGVVTSLSTSAMTITGATTTGFVVIEGY